MTDIAYIAGVLKGDGWCAQAIGLRVKDFDFADTFAKALNKECNLDIRPRLDERGYWLVRSSNKQRKFDYLLSYVPSTDQERAAWLRGLFDSEGNAELRHIEGNSYGRRIAIYSTSLETLNQATEHFRSLGIAVVLTATKNSIGHKGTKTVYEVKLRSRKENYARFAELVSSSIERKRVILNAIPGSYQIDSEYCKRGQRLGAEAKHSKTMNTTLPQVIEGVRQLIRDGVKPTQRACRDIAGYNTIQKWVPQADLVAMAINGDVLPEG